MKSSPPQDLSEIDELIEDFADSINRSTDFNWERHIIPDFKSRLQSYIDKQCLESRIDELKYWRRRFENMNPVLADDIDLEAKDMLLIKPLFEVTVNKVIKPNLIQEAKDRYWELLAQRDKEK